MSAPALELASIEFAVPDSHARRVVGEALRHVPVPQSPPLVLRTWHLRSRISFATCI